MPTSVPEDILPENVYDYHHARERRIVYRLDGKHTLQKRARHILPVVGVCNRSALSVLPVAADGEQTAADFVYIRIQNAVKACRHIRVGNVHEYDFVVLPQLVKLGRHFFLVEYVDHADVELFAENFRKGGGLVGVALDNQQVVENLQINIGVEYIV